jgi:hypothetical protein
MPLKKLKSIGKKVLGGAGKAVKKLVPKEVAGIMQAAAPFVAASNPMAALALTTAGQYRQRGRISPLQTALSLAPSPQVRGFTKGDVGLFGLDSLKLTGRAADIGKGLDTFLYGAPEQFALSAEPMGVGGTSELLKVADAKQGLIGEGGKFGFKKFMEGSLLSPGGKLSKSRVAAAAVAGLSLAQTQAQIEEEAVEAGASDSELARLQQEAAEMWEDFDTTAFRPKITAAIGGLMRKNLANGTFFPKPKPEDYGIEDNELPPEPKPFTPGPKPSKMAEAVDVDILRQMFMEALKNGEIPPGTDFDTYKNMMMTLMSKTQAKKGGLMRSNYALGSMPTKEESGLGGLPIEADMRYTGGFMPYGAKEKADDVPARLSKNEFVFTADAVRAAGGGSVQKGAQRMYNTMKQLESMGKMA